MKEHCWKLTSIFILWVPNRAYFGFRSWWLSKAAQLTPGVPASSVDSLLLDKPPLSPNSFSLYTQALLPPSQRKIHQQK